MGVSMKSYLGRVHTLASNPRVIRDNAFNRLAESIERDPDFLLMRGIVVWQVPTVLSAGADEKSPFRGQEGKLVVLGGNQRMNALKALGKTELKKEWLIEAKDAGGKWIGESAAERFVLLDNNPEGISGSHDYEKMLSAFSEVSMRLSGIDFSSFKTMTKENTIVQTAEQSSTETAEKGDYGENNEALKTFIEHREETRKDLKEIDDTGFYLLLVFESLEEKIAFISRAGLTGKNGVVRIDADEFVCLVFESYAQKMKFVKDAGLADDEDGMGDGELEVVYGKFCDGRALARKMGIELAESGLHFRNRPVDSQLAEMTRDDAEQMDEAKQMEALARDRGFVPSAKNRKKPIRQVKSKESKNG